MPKLLIIEACMVNFADDRGGVHQSAGDMPSVPKDAAHALIAAGRALYVDKKEDPDKQGRNTASQQMLHAAEAMAKPSRKNASTVSVVVADPADPTA